MEMGVGGGGWFIYVEVFFLVGGRWGGGLLREGVEGMEMEIKKTDRDRFLRL